MKGRIFSGVEGLGDWNYFSFPDVMKRIPQVVEEYCMPKESKGELIQVYLINNPSGLVSCVDSNERNSLTRIFIHASNKDDLDKIGELVLKAARKNHIGWTEKI